MEKNLPHPIFFHHAQNKFQHFTLRENSYSQKPMRIKAFLAILPTSTLKKTSDYVHTGKKLPDLF